MAKYRKRWATERPWGLSVPLGGTITVSIDRAPPRINVTNSEGGTE